ncbi:allatostatin-A receptor-like [Centruroides vittatus]|uniref:allatostatin-A receptor-like n=1 Tax=Centruroides vittatus TaxID=120091 RepID=UPI00350EE448
MHHCLSNYTLDSSNGTTTPCNVTNMTSLSEDDDLPDDVIFWDHPEEMLIPWLVSNYFFPIVITYIITFVVGVSGNAVVISVMAGDRTSRNVTSIFLVSLAVADLLLLVICAPLDVAHYFVVQWDHEGAICKLAAYAETVSAFASVLNLVAVTLERFVVIVFPIRSRSVCTMSNCKKLMIFVWIVSLLLAIPAVATKNIEKLIFTNHKVTVILFSCKELDDWRGFTVAVYRLVMLFALPSVLMIVCYARVIMELWISTRTMDELTNTVANVGVQRLNRIDSRSSISRDSHLSCHQNRLLVRDPMNTEYRDVKKARQQVIKMLILVVVLFLVCWGPKLLMEIIRNCCLDVYNHGIYTSRFIFYLLPFVHSCLNPIVYCFMSTKFRRRMFRCFERTCGNTCVSICCCKTPSVRRQARHMSTMSRNGTTRVGSTYTFTSYTCSPSGETTKITELDTVTL